MTVIMIALPVGIQTDRIILSHVTTSAELAQYNLASQMYTPIFALVSGRFHSLATLCRIPGKEQRGVAAATFTRVWSDRGLFLSVHFSDRRVVGQLRLWRRSDVDALHY